MRGSIVLWIALGGAAPAGDPVGEGKPTLPPALARPVSFSREVRPLLVERCFKCHGDGKSRGGLRMDSREFLQKGGKNGPVVVPGKSAESLLIRLVAGLVKEKVMPREGPPLSAGEVGILRAWIDQGLAWEEVPAAGDARRSRKSREVDLELVRPPIPPGGGPDGANPVDRFLEPYFEAHRIEPGPPVEDRIFLRRVSLDAIGLLSSEADEAGFAADRSPGRYQNLARRLLSRKRAYAEHWLSFWNDLLRNDYRGTGYIDGGRKQITGWLYSALARNLPYDRMVAELLDPGEESAGFMKGIVWRGVTNASQTPAMQAAQNVSQVFMGINLKCASCHDSFVSDWTLKEAYGLANVFSPEPLEVVRCDTPTGERAPTGFLYPALGIIDPAERLPRRLSRLAAIVTARQNGRLARTMVNRLWARFFAHGLIDPPDEMENPSWNNDLLNWLAADLVDHGYDLKHAMERIFTSRAYRLASVSLDEKAERDFTFRGPAVRRMSAEQFADAIGSLTGVGQTFPDAPVDFSCLAESEDRDQAGVRDAPRAGSWIWAPGKPSGSKRKGSLKKGGNAGPGKETVYLRRQFRLEERPESAAVVAASGGSFTVYLNGKRIGSGKEPLRPVLLKAGPELVEGENTVAVEAGLEAGAGPPGFFFQARIRGRTRAADLSSDSDWLSTRDKSEGWEKPVFAAGAWPSARVLSGRAAPPLSLVKRLAAVLEVASDAGRFRASLVSADRLMTALGRPNREQVVSRRRSAATTLEALELTNGATLSGWLRRGAERLASPPISGRELVARLYRRALGRAASKEELAAALEMTGEPASALGVEDFLWCFFMLPEFQLIQ
jgi:hypothetical protein